jgi:hypothetical protein
MYMTRWKNVLWISAATLALTLVAGSVAPTAIAQVRAALVRDADNPALQPFRGIVGYTLNTLNEQRLITTVPAGKRLVIEHISWIATNTAGQQIIFAGLRNSQFGTFIEHLKINPPHLSATSSLTLQEGSEDVKVYYEPGEEVWISASKNAGNFSEIHVNLHGYFVTL